MRRGGTPSTSSFGRQTSAGTTMGSFQWNLKSLVVLGILFHCVYLFSIIDIYFRSPIVHGMTPHASSLQPPAQRVLVFVGTHCLSPPVLAFILNQ
jgi:hypothetical protein